VAGCYDLLIFLLNNWILFSVCGLFLTREFPKKEGEPICFGWSAGVVWCGAPFWCYTCTPVYAIHQSMQETRVYHALTYSYTLTLLADRRAHINTHKLACYTLYLQVYTWQASFAKVHAYHDTCTTTRALSKALPGCKNNTHSHQNWNAHSRGRQTPECLLHDASMTPRFSKFTRIRILLDWRSRCDINFFLNNAFACVCAKPLSLTKSLPLPLLTRLLCLVVTTPPVR